MGTLSWFLWVIGYGALFTLSEICSNLIGVSHCITAFSVLAYAVALVIYLQKVKPFFSSMFSAKIKTKHLLLFLPLIFLPIFNLFVLDNAFDPFQIILFIGVCVVEEVFFRGLLLGALKLKYGALWGAVLSSLAFALFHVVNIINDFEPIFALMQVLSAFAIGTCFSALTIKTKSLLPCTVVHFIINLTGVGLSVISKLWWALSLGLISLIYLAYGLTLIYFHQKQDTKPK